MLKFGVDPRITRRLDPALRRHHPLEGVTNLDLDPCNVR
jgi:hypothetical protein